MNGDTADRLINVYFVHNGYSGWSYGTPADPQLISPMDAAELMRRAKLSLEQVNQAIPPAQYAEVGDPLYDLTGGNRFLCFGDIRQCSDIKQQKISIPLRISWSAT